MGQAQLVRGNASSWNKKSIIFVHGIGDQPETYAAPLVDILKNTDPTTVAASRWYAVAYDFVNDAMQQKLRPLQEAIQKHDGAQPGAANTTTELLIDLVNYLGTKDLKSWIDTAYKKVLVEIVLGGLDENVSQREHEIFIICHSLGTVVTYETLHDIVGDPQTLGVAKNFRVKALFTMGSPLAFIKKNESLIPSFGVSYLRTQPIGRPGQANPFTGKVDTNVLDWYNFRQEVDPVASITPLDQKTANGALSEETFTFKKFHSGANPHDYGNYVTEYAPFIMEKIRA